MFKINSNQFRTIIFRGTLVDKILALEAQLSESAILRSLFFLATLDFELKILIPPPQNSNKRVKIVSLMSD